MKIFDTCLKIEEILKGYLIASNKTNDKKKSEYYKHEAYRLNFTTRELDLFYNWGFSNLIYVPHLNHWACVMPKDYKYLNSTSYPYSKENPPIIFVSGNVDSVLDEYLSELDEYLNEEKNNERKEV